MNINKSILSIIERPSFNLLAFQAFTLAVLAIAGVPGAFQFIPFYGFKDSLSYYFIVYFYIATGAIIYTSIIFLIGCIFKKLHIILFNKYLIIMNFILFYIIYTILIHIYYIPSSTPTATDTYGWMIVFGIIFSIYSILYCAVPLYILTIIVELIRKIILKPMPYRKTPVRFYAVVIPTIIYICIILYTIISFFTMRFI